MQAAIFDVFHDDVKLFVIFNHLLRFHDVLMIGFLDRHNLVLEQSQGFAILVR